MLILTPAGLRWFETMFAQEGLGGITAQKGGEFARQLGLGGYRKHGHREGVTRTVRRQLNEGRFVCMGQGHVAPYEGRIRLASGNRERQIRRAGGRAPVRLPCVGGR